MPVILLLAKQKQGHLELRAAGAPWCDLNLSVSDRNLCSLPHFFFNGGVGQVFRDGGIGVACQP